MAVNRDKVDKWKADVVESVEFFNEWFMKFAPDAFRSKRIETTEVVEKAFLWTKNLTDISETTLLEHPEILSMLRMTTSPPLARDRIIGLAGLTPNLVKNMEVNRLIPPRMEKKNLYDQLYRMGDILEKMADPDILVWKKRGDTGSKEEIHRATIIIADRLCGAIANPIIRNAQEQRQLLSIKTWLEAHGYREIKSNEVDDWLSMPKGTFSYRFNIPVTLESMKQVKIPVDVVIMRRNAGKGEFPLLFEAKSAGDFTNTNKRRKEEAIKVQQLRRTYGTKVSFDLFLCGYFDSGYLGYEAAEGIDWVWEHRIDDFNKFGL